MTVDAFRLKNFMAFRDTGWIELRAITLLFGRNSSGKSAIIRSLRLLKQSLHRLQATPILRFAVEGQLDLGDFTVALHRRAVVENYAEQVEGQKISFQFRGDMLGESIAILHAYVNSWLEQNNLLRLDSLGSLSELQQIEFSLEYGQKYDRDTNQLVIELVGIHIDCPWPILSSRLGRSEESINFLSASRIPPVHYKNDELSLPEAPSENYPGYMEWNNEWYWESDWGLEQQAISEASIWRDITITAIEDFFPTLKTSSISINASEYKPNDLLVYRLNEILGKLNQTIKNFLDQIEYLGPIRPTPERTYLLKRSDIEHWKKMGLNAWLDILQKGAFAPPPIIKTQDTQDQAASIMTKWLKELSLGEQLYVRRFAEIPQSDLVAQIFIRNSGNEWINLLDVGYGASQVLPIIATCVNADPGKLILIEQPELHLHPRAQARLGNLFAATARQSKRIFIETHSEHLLLRAQRLVGETTVYISSEQLNKVNLDQIEVNPQDLYLKQMELGIYFVSREGRTKVIMLEINDIGEIISKDIPIDFEDFFADDLIESSALVQISLEKIENESRN